jgi:hypothetical protein
VKSKFEANMITRKLILPFLLAGILLASCGGQGEASPTPDLNAILTSAIGTVAESMFQTQTALVPPATETPVPTITPLPTDTLAPLPLSLSSPTATFLIFNTLAPVSGFSPTPTGTRNTPTANPSTLAYGCNNLRLINDVTVPANTVFKPGDTFTKTWQVENSGTCDWVYQYRLVFVGGNQMEGKPDRLNKVIGPGKWTQLSVILIAPKNPGTYTSSWRFGDQAGNAFGSTLGVTIVVSPPTNTPQPTATHTPIPTATEEPTVEPPPAP